MERRGGVRERAGWRWWRGGEQGEGVERRRERRGEEESRVEV